MHFMSRYRAMSQTFDRMSALHSVKCAQLSACWKSGLKLKNFCQPMHHLLRFRQLYDAKLSTK